MLHIERKAGKAIRINDDIEITVLSMRGGQVKIGVSAPKSISVHREEIYKLIQSEKGSKDNV